MKPSCCQEVVSVIHRLIFGLIFMHEKSVTHSHLINTIVVLPIVNKAEDYPQPQLRGHMDDVIQRNQPFLIVHTKGSLKNIVMRSIVLVFAVARNL